RLPCSPPPTSRSSGSSCAASSSSVRAARAPRERPMNEAPHRPRYLAVLGALGALAALALAAWLAMDAYARHGLSVRWQTIEGRRIVDVTRTTEHRIQFPTQHRALSRIVEAWDYEAN